MSPIRSAVVRNIICSSVLVLTLAGLAAGQNLLASVSIPTASAGEVAVNPALNKIYTGGAPKAGASLTVIDGVTFTVVTTISSSAGVSADMKNDNFWTGNFTGNVLVYAGKNNTQISSTTVGSCPAAVTFSCKRMIWVASECGSGNDPVWAFDPDKLVLIGSAVTPGGTITQLPVVNPDSGKLYVTSGGVSKEVDPKTFAVSNTTFGTVLAIDSNTNKLFATSGSNFQIINGHTDTVIKTVTLTYTPAAIGVNNAMAHVYVVNSTGNSIDVYGETGKKITSFALGANNQPNSLAVDSARGRLFVDVFNTGSSSWSLDVIEDLSTVRSCEIPGSCDY